MADEDQVPRPVTDASPRTPQRAEPRDQRPWPEQRHRINAADLIHPLEPSDQWDQPLIRHPGDRRSGPAVPNRPDEGRRHHDIAESGHLQDKDAHGGNIQSD